MRKQPKSIFSLAFVLTLAPTCVGQASHSDVALAMQIASPRADSVLSVPYGYVDLTNGNLHLSIPYKTVAGANGRSHTLDFTYNSRTWSRVDLSTASFWGPDPTPWTVGYSAAMGTMLYTREYVEVEGCSSGNSLQPRWSGFAFKGKDSTHVFPFDTTQSCNALSTSQARGYAQDGSGYYAVLTTDAYQTPDQIKVWSPSGDLAYSGFYSGSSFAPVDSNGSHLDAASETLPDDSTAAQNIGVYSTDFIQVPYSTFGSAWGSTGTASQSSAYLKQLTLPDGRQFSMTYDTCPNNQACTGSEIKLGLLRTLTLPTGGTITFEYATFPIPGSNDTTVGEVRVSSVSFSGETSANCAASNATSGTTWQICWHTNVASNTRYFTSVDLLQPQGSNGARGLVTRDLSEYFVGGMRQNWVASNVRAYSGSAATGTPLQDVSYTYYGPTRITAVDVSRDGSYVSRKRFGYWDHDLPMISSEREVDSNSNILKETTYTFQSNLSSTDHPSALTNHFPDRPLTMRTYGAGGSSGAAVAGANFGYDEFAIASNSGYRQQSVLGLNWHDDSNFGSAMNSRGNLTSIARMTTGGSYVTTATHLYNILGQRISSADANGNTTNYDWYSDAWGDASCSTAATFFFQTHTKNVLNQETANKINSCTGTVKSSQDANDLLASRAGTVYGYDAGGRPTSVTYPDGGQTTIMYTDGPGSVIAKTTQTGGPAGPATSKEFLDPFGRVKRTEGTGGEKIDTVYDFGGRPTSVSNPFTGSAASSYTSTIYDSLGRASTVIAPDSSQRSNSYSGLVATVTDEASTKTILTTNLSGQLASVKEAGKTSQPLDLLTDYTYDTLGNLTRVEQHGDSAESARNRYFTYDPFSRLLTANNPEAGMITYQYLKGDGTFCSGDLSAACSQTDARGQTTSFTYDALNRVKTKALNGQTVAWYGYDGESHTWGYPPMFGQNRVGRMSAVWGFNPDTVSGCDPGGLRQCYGLEYGYDVMGRLNHVADSSVSEWGSTFHATEAQFDLAGNPVQYQYPDGTVIRNSYDSAGRLQKVWRVANPAQSASAPATGDTNFLSGISYLPDGSPSSTSYGNGVVEQRTVNARLQPCESYAFLPAALGGSLLFDRQYSYAPGTGTASVQNAPAARTPGQPCPTDVNNNGNIGYIVDGTNATLTTNRTQAFTYDSLNRLTGWDAGISGGVSRHQQFLYDSFGNMQQTDTGNPKPALGYADGLASPAVSGNSWPYGADNRLLSSTFHCSAAPGATGMPGSFMGYDLAGNIACTGRDGTDARAFTWNAESQIGKVYGVQNNAGYYLQARYTYDGLGNRIQVTQFVPQSSPLQTQSFRDYSFFGGQMLAEKDQAGNWTNHIYANGKRIATVPGQDHVLHLSGHRTQSWGFARFDLAPPAGYVVGAGDRMCWRQKSLGISGGPAVWFDLNGKDSMAQLWAASDGQTADNMAPSTQWASRCVDLTYGGQNTGSSVIMVALLAWDRNGTYNSWDEYFADMSIISGKGTVTQIIGLNPPGVIASPYGTGDYGQAKQWAVEAPAMGGQGATQMAAAHYFLGDQLGTAQLELTGAGFPVWKGEFAPFGQEMDSQETANRFKFTGKERDAESGLDYFGARYYGSSMGRWMSPDFSTNPISIPFARIDNPQTLNLYSYVGNNSMRYRDSFGHSADCNHDGDKSVVCLVTTLWDKIKGALGGGNSNNSQPSPTPPPDPGPGPSPLFRVTSTISRPSFYSLNGSFGHVSGSFSYVPETRNFIWGPGVGVSVAPASLMMTAGYSRRPEDFLRGSSVQGCGAFVVAGCYGRSVSLQGVGEQAYQIGLGTPDIGGSVGYGLDYNSYIVGLYETIPLDPMATIPGPSGLNIEDPQMGLDPN